ncbi:ComEA family DNA-binding protein [Anditalea andensis]|uniref:Helix-hairpin-helix DNA-binding motif class 1 domain-containing protein n=1 Tax=Anditalea andensis TaxID=1048983 RepID=A0A074KTW4_9BACT|nr:helix-hairpin-helix domain-containing protein [Anditalea andensis]KEO72354.1 hypothetical protein EL17_16540 [Anditalea andensis]
MKRRLVIGLIIYLHAGIIYAQTFRRNDIDLEALIEELFPIQDDEDLDYENIYENLLQLFLNPLPLNRATAEELQSLYLLSPLQINSIIEHRDTFGPMLSVYELQAVPEMDLQTIYRLIPFVTIADGESYLTGSLWKRITHERDAYLIIRHRRVWETRKGYTAPDTLSSGRLTSRYMGDPNDLYVRFRIQHVKDFSLGFTLDKDPGEQFIWDPSTHRYKFNFVSAHFTVYNKGKWKAISIGDFQMQSGQGLVFGAGFSVGKGAETITTVRRSTIGLRPYTSVLEYGFFRGAAATYSLESINVTALASSTPRDGRIETILDTLERQDAFISSLMLSGLHRTPTEIANKAQAREQNLGINLHYQSIGRKLQVGMNALLTSFSQPFIRSPRIYNQFEFRGQYNHIKSAYFSYNLQNYFFFGESAISKSGGTGTVLGLMSSLNPNVDLSVLWRKYDRDFHSLYGNAFSEGTRPINETGLYLGLNIKPLRKVNWSGYYDQFRFPWLRFRAYAPSEGYEWLQRLAYNPSRQLMLYLQVREETKDRNTSLENTNGHGYNLRPAKRRNYLANLDFAIDKQWSIKSRVQFSTFEFEKNQTSGFAIIQDLNLNMDKWKWSGRIALFDTEDYENRQYVFERNVLWAFSIPQYNGQGVRYYLLGQYRLSPKLTFWGRMGRTTYTDREIISSGLQEINGHRLTETTFQMRYQFNR